MSLRLARMLPLLALAACSGPVFLLPGGRLDGQSRSAPADWTFAGASGTAQLETRPEHPYSVNLAFTILDGALYVNVGGTETQWVENMTRNPLVRLRLEGALYDLRAERVMDRGEILAFAKAWNAQSFFRRDPAGFDEVWVYLP